MTKEAVHGYTCREKRNETDEMALETKQKGHETEKK